MNQNNQQSELDEAIFEGTWYFKTSIGVFSGTCERIKNHKMKPWMGLDHVAVFRLDNKECLKDLYKSVEPHSVLRSAEGEYWLSIELGDGFYGSPEYQLYRDLWSPKNSLAAC